MKIGLIGLVVALAIGLIVALNSLFIVNPTQQALVLQFGEVRQAIREPGLNTKIPVVQDVLFLDKRVLDLNVPAQEIIAADQKRLVVDAFMRYRIANPVRFYQTVNNVREGATRLSTFAQSSLRAVLADATFTEIVRDDRPDLMRRITDDVAARARDIGVEIVDAKIRRADLPEANSQAIFDRMVTEREQEATQIRAQGQEAAQRVQAAADRTATVLRAEAQREAEQVRGEGDGQANAIFAEAYSQDPSFFGFYRAMQAYEQALASSDTRLVLSPDADFFRYFNDPAGITRRAPPRQPDGQPPLEASAPAAPGLPGISPDEGVGSEEDPDEAASIGIPTTAEGEATVLEAAATADEAIIDPEAGMTEATAGVSPDGTPAETSVDEAIAEADPAPSPAANAAAEADVSDTVAASDAGIEEAAPGSVTIIRPEADPE